MTVLDAEFEQELIRLTEIINNRLGTEYAPIDVLRQGTINMFACARLCLNTPKRHVGFEAAKRL